jgi:hypothetical protein
MMGLPLGVIVEGLVSILLILTIGYSILLNERLKRLHADRDMLKQMVADLVQATDQANGAIRELRQTAMETDLAMTARIEEADRFAVELANHVTSGQAVLDRIVKILAVSRQRGEAAGVVQVPTGRAQEALERLRAHRYDKDAAA